MPERIAWYMTSLALKFRIPVDSTLVLLVERHAPREVPGQCRIRLGSLEVVTQYRVERLWEMDPDAGRRRESALASLRHADAVE